MKTLITLLLALSLTGCVAVTPWGQTQTSGNKIIATHSAKRTILVITTEGEFAEQALVESMKETRKILINRWPRKPAH